MSKMSTTNMTQGKPMRHILVFTIPLLIGNIFQVLYNMVDTIIVGRTISTEALAAVGSAGAIMFLIVGLSIGLTNGFSIMVAQRFGAQDESGVRKSVAMGCMLCVIASIILTVVGITSAESLLKLMNTPDEIMADAHSYILMIYYGMTATVFYNYFSSIIRALGDSKTPLIFLLIASLLNIVLDLLFILTFHMGTAGAGLATVVAQGVSAVLCLLLVNKKFPILKPHKNDWKWNGRSAWYHLRLGLPMAIQFGVNASGVVIVQSVLNTFGATIIAGYTAANKIEQLITQPMLSFGTTMATYAGQNFGAEKLERIRQGVRKSLMLVTCFAVAGALIITLFGKNLAGMFITGSDMEPTKFAQIYLWCAAPFYLILGYLFIFRNTLQGINKGFIALLGSFFELTARIVLSLVLAPTVGYVGVCLAGPFAWLSAGIFYIIMYFIDMRKLDHTKGVV